MTVDISLPSRGRKPAVGAKLISLWKMLSTFANCSERVEHSEEGARDTAAGQPDSDRETPPTPIPMELTDVIDLHPFAPRDVKAVVEAYLEEARTRGFSTVRIIHGKGVGVQRSLVRSLLARTPFVSSFEDAPMGAGSWGATVVWFSHGPRKTADRKEPGGNCG